MSYAEQNSPFGQLPPEIFPDIFCYLGIADKKIIRIVCRRWRSICEDQTNFKFTPVIDGNDSVKSLLNAGVTIENVTFKNVTQANWPYPTLTRNQLPQIRTVTLDTGNADDAILPFLYRFGRGNLEGLQLREHSFFNFGIPKMTHVFQNMAWENLSELNFSLNHDRANLTVLEQDLENPEDFTKFGSSLELFLNLVKVPKLRKLVLKYNEMKSVGGRLENWEVVGRETMFKPFFNALVGFLSRHSRTLKIFDWTVQLTRRIEVDEQGWTVSRELQEILNRDLKLESFSIEFCRWGNPNHIHEPATLVFPCVWGSTGLTTFTCRIVEKLRYMVAWWERYTGWYFQFNNECIINKIEETMRNNVQTLENVSIPMTSTIQLNNLNNCPNLRKLTLTTYEYTFNDMDTNLNLRLPKVTHLELKAFESTLPLTLDSWIIRVFRGIESIKIYGYPLTQQHDWTLSVQMVCNLLQLSKLKTIEETQGTQLPGQHWFDEHVNGFCSRSTDPVLNYRVTQSHDQTLGTIHPCLTSVAITVIRS